MVCGCCCSQFHSVWRNHVAAGIFLVIQALRVNKDGNSQLMPEVNNFLTNFTGQYALAIIGKNYGGAARKVQFDFGYESPLQLLIHSARALYIEAQHLLPSAQNARLADRGPFWH